MEFRRLEYIEPRIKVHILNKGYAHVPKRRDFTEDQKEEIWEKSKFSGIGGILKTSYHSTTLHEVGDECLKHLCHTCVRSTFFVRFYI